MKHSKKMSAEKFKRATEYREGDIVQIRPDGYEYSGRLGQIIGVTIYKQKSGKALDLSYRIKLSDEEGISAPAHRIRLVREAESNEDLPERESQFLHVRANRSIDDEMAE